jgi:protein-S-isoprenylcysteine O-methyltransferase Ste14
VLTPVAAALLIKGVTGPLDATGLGPCPPLVAALLGWAGLAAFAAGNVIMYWGRVTLGRSFRIGAVPPAGSDRLVTRGPYRCVRHPMYTAVIAMPLGLGMLLQSYVFLAAALVTLLSVVRLIPIEEAQLVSAYGGEYERYRDRTRRLLPLVY